MKSQIVNKTRSKLLASLAAIMSMKLEQEPMELQNKDFINLSLSSMIHVDMLNNSIWFFL